MDVDPVIPQSQPLADDQVKNSAGGFTWKVDDMKRLARFFCFGAEGGTYYIKEKELAIQNAKCVQRLLEAGKGKDVVKEVVGFSEEGRAAKQNPIIFTLAMCARQDGDPEVKKAAYDSLVKVCRIPTHLFHFIEYSEKLSRGSGWGRAHRRAISNWYTRFKGNPKRLAQHVTKYKNRNGWTHRDVLRLSHLKTEDSGVAMVCKYIIKGLDVAKSEFIKEDSSQSLMETAMFLEAVENVKQQKEVSDVVEMIQKHGLVREHIPTQFLKSSEIWHQLLQNMPMTAMIRNLGKMSAMDIFSNKDDVALAVKKLNDEKSLKEAKIHPFNVLVALYTYKNGKGDKGKLAWPVNGEITKALNQAFYKSFKFVEPTHQRYLLALDVSGSMSFQDVNGCRNITPRDASAALSMVTARTETTVDIVGFSSRLTHLDIKPSMDLEAVIDYMNGVPMGGTDCAQPMLWAAQKNKLYDVFVVYTDCETWCGSLHPAEALRQYRRQSGIWNAKLIVCAMTSNGFTIADPEDPGMMDMAGFDSNGPEIMRNFALGLI